MRTMPEPPKSLDWKTLRHIHTWIPTAQEQKEIVRRGLSHLLPFGRFR